MSPRQPSLFDLPPDEPTPAAPVPVSEQPAPALAGRCCEVVLEVATRALDRPLTYAIGARLEGELGVGSYVRVPLGRQFAAGYVVALHDEAPAGIALRPVTGKLVDEDPLDPEQVALAGWLAETCRAGLAACLRCFLPPGSARRVIRSVTVTPAGRAPEALVALGAAPNQRVALEFLRDNPGVAPTRLRGLYGKDRKAASKASAALAALEQRGFIHETRTLQRPAGSAKTRQFASLVEGDPEPDWVELMEGLESRAPRQAEVIAALLEADGEPVPVASLPRDAVTALERAGLVAVNQQRVMRLPGEAGLSEGQAQPPVLSADQQAVVGRISEALAQGAPETFLLHGVTGSGKTEVYLAAIQATLDAGRSAIVLVPEISLTPQAVGRFRRRFGSRLALLHSALGAGERFDEWERIRRGEADLVVGARSAVFAPCRNLGIVVVDEEHEHAYHQDAEPRYNAHAVAAQRARLSGAVLVLGSATPSIETYHAATGPEPTIRLLELPRRIDDRELPPVQIVDLRREPRGNHDTLFAGALLEALGQCLAAGEQAMIFLNRRGYSTYVMCRDCGHSLRCPDCAVSLTYHHASRQMRCHHCDLRQAVPDRCPACDGYDVAYQGLGTERVMDQLGRLLPEARVLRMDRDTTAAKGAHGRILNQFAQGEADILVGTQMIAKGHDFANVTLVGVLNADTGLNRPDFRAAEQTFQLLTQVGGRAGRAQKPGRVIVQTFNPDHPAVEAACRHDYRAFYAQELASREANRYPPFVHLIKLGFADEDQDRGWQTALRAAEALRDLGVRQGPGPLQLVGPSEAPLHKLRGVYRHHLVVKGESKTALREVVEAALVRLGETGETLVQVDLNPVDMM